MEKITITTEDGISLSGLWIDQGSNKSVILLHMMPATKESWIPLIEKLPEKEYNILAIDFRGHGESGGGNYQEFAPEEHYKYRLDMLAARKFVEERYPNGHIYFGGASIGANFSLVHMAEHPEIKKAFALSAGLDYYGIRAIDAVQNLKSDQSVLFIGAHDDLRGGDIDCGTQVAELYEKATSQKERIVYETGGHGTDMWVEHPELLNQITDFLNR